jgi:hypothetical protein
MDSELIIKSEYEMVLTLNLQSRFVTSNIEENKQTVNKVQQQDYEFK